MNDHGMRRLAVLVASAGADIMDSVDPDDRSSWQVALVDATKELIEAASAGDVDARGILIEAVPSWYCQNCYHPADAHQSGSGPWTGFCGVPECECEGLGGQQA